MANDYKSFKLIIFVLFLILTVLIFSIGVLLGYQIKKPPKTISTQEYKSDYPYLSDNTYYKNPDDTIISFKSLKTELETYILYDKKRVGVYFEYLPSGTSIGVNDDITLTGASLFKIPFVMQTYKLAEENKINLNDKITINNQDIDTTWGNLGYTGLGQEYKIKDLIYEIVVNSDNTAFNALYHNAGKSFPEDLFNELDLDLPKVSEDYVISTDTSPRQYSKILKSLFYSSYLNRESSNEILTLMTQIKDGQGLRSDIPENVKIAHKIGIKSANPNHEMHFLSDCGIIYIPKRPYILCMMVQEDDITAIKYMNTISDKVYDHVSSAKTSSHNQ